jgi:hypothetical protein
MDMHLNAITAMCADMQLQTFVVSQLQRVRWCPTAPPPGSLAG